jgi:hypothetical protein
LKLLTKKSPALKIELFLNTILLLKLFFFIFLVNSEEIMQ